MPPLQNLFDPMALGLVVAGTLLATIARSGFRDARAALGAIVSPTFDADQNRSIIAHSLRSIKDRGPLCADAPAPPDPALRKSVKVYLTTGSLKAFAATFEEYRDESLRNGQRIVSVYESAADLAPMFGLVGTLVAIIGLGPASPDNQTSVILGAISAAVQSTLFGVLLSSFLFAPLGAMASRKLMEEEQKRLELFEWFMDCAEEKRPRDEPLREVRDVP